MKLEEKVIGHLGVCHHGLIGQVEFAEMLTTGLFCKGYNVLTGESWSSLRPRLLDPAVEKVIRSTIPQWSRK